MPEISPDYSSPLIHRPLIHRQPWPIASFSTERNSLLFNALDVTPPLGSAIRQLLFRTKGQNSLDSPPYQMMKHALPKSQFQIISTGLCIALTTISAKCMSQG